MPPFLRPLPPPPPPPTPVELLFDNLQGGFMRKNNHKNRFAESRSAGGGEWWQRFKFMGISSSAVAVKRKNMCVATPALPPPSLSTWRKVSSAPPVFGPTRRPKRPKTPAATTPDLTTSPRSSGSSSGSSSGNSAAASSPKSSSGPRVATRMPKGGTEIVLDNGNAVSGQY